MSSTFRKKRVAVLRGGPSSEYEISMKSGLGVTKSLSELGYDSKDIIITKKGEWLVQGFVRSPERMLADVDVVFIALHGSYGEDGTVQRMLDRFAIPYTGSGAFGSAIAMNKALTKDQIKKTHPEIKLAPHLRVTREGSANIGLVVHSITEIFGPEYVVKPVSGGSSIGTVLVDAGGLLKAVTQALDEYDEVIVEKRIRGREATVGILEDFREQRYYELPSIEIIPPSTASFFSSDAKYSGKTDEICPGRFSKDEKNELSESALKIHTALGLSQYSRSDFIVTEDGAYFLEVNTLPGLTSESLFPKSMAAVGSSYNELISHLVETARLKK